MPMQVHELIIILHLIIAHRVLEVTVELKVVGLKLLYTSIHTS
jgi:hypothetical protein